MSLFSWEWRVAVDFGIQISRENVLDLSSDVQVRRLQIWKLDPVLQNVVSYPENELIGSSTSFLDIFPNLRLFGLVKNSLSYVVISLCSIDLSPKTKGCGATQSH